MKVVNGPREASKASEEPVFLLALTSPSASRDLDALLTYTRLPSRAQTRDQLSLTDYLLILRTTPRRQGSLPSYRRRRRKERKARDPQGHSIAGRRARAGTFLLPLRCPLSARGSVFPTCSSKMKTNSVDRALVWHSVKRSGFPSLSKEGAFPSVFTHASIPEPALLR